MDAAISDDGSTVAFVTDATNLIDGSTDTRTHVYVVELETRAISRITGDGVSGSVNHDEFLNAAEVGLNGDGSLVTYRGGFKDNFAGQPFLSGHWLYDRSTGKTTILTAQATGLSIGLPAKGTSFGVADLTPDGRYAVFNYLTTTGSTGQILPGIGQIGTTYTSWTGSVNPTSS